MMTYLALGVMLGLSAGFAPGPLLTLVILETLRHRIGAGIRVAMAPMITDLPIVLVSFLLLVRMQDSSLFLGIVALAGGSYLFYLGGYSLLTTRIGVEDHCDPPRSIRKAVMTNFLNPHPYLFWMTVGGPLVVRAQDIGIIAVIFFLGGFYLCLVGAKVVLALLVGRSRSFLTGRFYSLAMKLLGAALLVLGVMLLVEGTRMLPG